MKCISSYSNTLHFSSPLPHPRHLLLRPYSLCPNQGHCSSKSSFLSCFIIFCFLTDNFIEQTHKLSPILKANNNSKTLKIPFTSIYLLFFREKLLERAVLYILYVLCPHLSLSPPDDHEIALIKDTFMWLNGMISSPCFTQTFCIIVCS